MENMFKLARHPFFIKLFNWEYWSITAFYWPLYVYFPFLALRSRHLCFFTATNPGIKSGGLGVESKFETIQKLPSALRPKTVLVKGKKGVKAALNQMASNEIYFPVIAKPDIGFRGLLVKKINNEKELEDYLKKYPIDFLIQEYIHYTVEVGVLYYRLPNQKKGHISSVTLKEFLHIVGDGKSTVEDLIYDNPRALLQLDRIRDSYNHLLATIPEKGDVVSLGVVGNHSKGTRFINGNHLIDDELIATFDKIASQIRGFYYGRFDIRCQDFHSLKAGKNFKILEVNGVGSEPTHIYDPDKISYFGALKDILKHWIIVHEIGMANHQLGIPYKPLRELLKEVWAVKRYEKMIEELSLV